MGIWEAIRNFFTGGSGGSDFSGGSGNRLYVGNLSYRIKEEELRSLFSKYGRIKSLHLIRDRLTRRLKGYAFMEMAPDDANKALALNGVDFLGRKLVVSLAKSRQRPHQHQHQLSSQSQEKPSGQRQESNRQQGRRQGGQRWRKRNRSGPRAYGQEGNSNEQLPRFE